MSDQIQEFLDIPRDFFKDGSQFITRCTKRTNTPPELIRSQYCLLEATFSEESACSAIPCGGGAK
jgi:hypothetical protein